MSLAEKLSEIKKGFLAKVPPETVEIIKRGTQELVDSGIESRALKVGEKFPLFSLNNQVGELVSAASLLEKGPLILSFYRGKW